MNSQADPKERMLQASIELLREASQPEAITVRQIAQRAGVGVGLINYHYGSKEVLMGEAIARLMRDAAGLDGPPPTDTGKTDPVESVRQILKQTSIAGLAYPRLVRMLARQALLGGDYGAERALLPLLREFFGATLSEPEIRVTALQIVAPLQVMAVRAEEFQVFSGLDVMDAAVFEQVVDRVVDNVLK